MSDNFRQSLGDKTENKLKPDSQKSTTERMGDNFKGTMDNATSTAQPQVSIITTSHFVVLKLNDSLRNLLLRRWEIPSLGTPTTVRSR